MLYARKARVGALFLFGLLVLSSAACGTPQTLTQETQDALKEAIEDEYRAEAVYAKVIAKFGETAPFSNIINAETKHSESLKKMYGNYGLTVPENPWVKDNSALPDYESVQAACQGGVDAEIANIAIYDRWLKMDLPDDIKTVFTSLRDASKDKHLPAFQQCAK